MASATSAQDLYNACFHSSWPEAEALLSRGVSAEFLHPESGASTLFVAVARHAPLPFIETLVRQGARLGVGDRKGFTPLHAACQYGASLEMVELLLTLGANVNQTAEDGATPLHFAAQYRARPAVFKALVNAGADVNSTKKNGATPLFCAVENGADVQTIRLLLKVGANSTLCARNPRTNSQHSPLSVARRNCTADVVAILEERDNETRRMGNNASSEVIDSSEPRTTASANLNRRVELGRTIFQNAFGENDGDGSFLKSDGCSEKLHGK